MCFDFFLLNSFNLKISANEICFVINYSEGYKGFFLSRKLQVRESRTYQEKVIAGKS